MPNRMERTKRPFQSKAMKAMKAMKAAGGVMTATQAYGSIAETTGLKSKDVKAIVEGMVTVAADQLKKNGSFKLAGALNQPSFEFIMDVVLLVVALTGAGVLVVHLRRFIVIDVWHSFSVLLCWFLPCVVKPSQPLSLSCTFFSLLLCACLASFFVAL